VSPAGPDSKAHLAGLMAGRSLARRLTEPWFAPFESAVGVPVTCIPGQAEPARHVAFADPAIAEALAEAGLDRPARAGTDLVTSTAIAASIELEKAFRDGRILPPGSFGFDLITNWARTRYGVATAGRSLTISTGCTAGLDAAQSVVGSGCRNKELLP